MRSERTIPILNALDSSKIERFVPYLLDTTLQTEKQFFDDGLTTSGYDMEAFAADNKLVLQWFEQLKQGFNEWRKQQHGETAPVNLVPTGSRSFGASYTESDLECAVVSEDYEEFLDFCRYLNTKYGKEHNFIAIKTAAGLPLLIVKGKAGFCCPELSELYADKTLPQLEITFRHPGVHDTIQKAGTDFFARLNHEELQSYVFNKRHIELISKKMSPEFVFEGQPIKSVIEAFKSALSAALKCLPPGKLQETPEFKKEMFINETLSGAIALNMTLYQQPAPTTPTPTPTSTPVVDNSAQREMSPRRI